MREDFRNRKDFNTNRKVRFLGEQRHWHRSGSGFLPKFDTKFKWENIICFYKLTALFSNDIKIRVILMYMLEYLFATSLVYISLCYGLFNVSYKFVFQTSVFLNGL